MREIGDEVSEVTEIYKSPKDLRFYSENMGSVGAFNQRSDMI